jgi:hypothetical protein
VGQRVQLQLGKLNPASMGAFLKLELLCLKAVTIALYTGTMD